MSQQAAERYNEGQQFDVVFSTDMLNLAEYRSLLTTNLAASLKPSPKYVTYFHENQFDYPSRFQPGSANQQRDLHFSFTNLITALSSDACWFNSRYNLDSMLQGIERQQRHWPDYKPVQQCHALKNRCEVQYPGVSISDSNRLAYATDRSNLTAHIAWAARWEHDKGPDNLLAVLRELRRRNFDFVISVVGEQFSKTPQAFRDIKSEFANQIEHWGYLESRADYLKLLADSDLFLSTAQHEYFGLSVAESIVMGAVPVLPNRLAYPELLAHLFPGQGIPMYESSDNVMEEASNASDLIIEACRCRQQFHSIWQANIDEMRHRVGWEARAQQMDHRLNEHVESIG